MKNEFNVTLSLTKGLGADIVGKTTLYRLLKEIHTDEYLLQEGKELAKLYVEDSKKYKLRKDIQPGFILGEFSYRDENNCLNYSPVLGFDIDKIKDEETKSAVFNSLQEWNKTFVVMPSVSGFGLRVLVKTKSTKEDHKNY